jgi:MoaA/NifB/PqqE/SkfB family radical SAM enzyme
MRRYLDETSALLSLEDFKKVLDSWNFQHVALHGWGEPLLNPHLFEMIKYAESQGVSTELTTNATLLWANIEKIFTSGLTSIAFGIHKSKILPVVISQIRELITLRNRKRLKKPGAYFDIVIYRRNQDEIAELVETAAALDIDAVVLHRVFNNYRTETDVRYISVQEEKDLFTAIKKIARKLNLKVYFPPEPSIPCRAVKYGLFVTSGGKILPCPFLPEFIMGDAFNGNLQEVITSQRYKQFVKNMREHPVCSKCPLGSTNGNFYSSEIRFKSVASIS